ncbi:beta-1,2-xylosyltransferase XYXT1-like isoform X4 [Carex rostrata]
MKRLDGSSKINKIKGKGIGAATVLVSLIAFLIVISLLESNSRASTILDLQPSFNNYAPLSSIEGTTNHLQQGKESNVVPISSEEKHKPENISSDNDEKPTLPTVSSEDTSPKEELVVKETNELAIPAEEKDDSNNSNQDDGGEMMLPTRLTEQWNQDKTTESSKMELNAEEKSETTEWSQDEATESSNTELNAEEKSEITESQSVNSENQEDIKPEEIPSNQNQKNKLECDFTHPRADTCTMEGDVRVLGTYSTVFLVSPTAQDTTESKIRPYARKWEKPTMQMIKEVNVKQALPDQAPPCTVHHDVPVVVFSTGGFVGNVFHDYTDILIPLFLAANQYEGKVQFAVTDMSWWWIFKYLPIIKTLSPYPILNLDQDKNVHCFPSAQIGVKSHKPMGVDPTQSPNGYTMQDFRAFIRKSFSLKRSYTRVIDLKSGKRPRLLILLRRGTRAIVNEKQLIAMAKKIGFRVVAADPDKTREFPKFAHVVNSCDVMLGVHGAGLANMLYLPTNATVLQILPWGDLGFVGRHDYGLPLPDMGLRYVEHEIKEDESTLIYKYPRDHAVFTNPQAIHDQGWDTMYRIFLNEQNIMLNVDRFKGVLIDVFKSYVR